MTDKELHRLRRDELLEILLSQQKEIDRLNAALEAAEKKLAEREILITNAGSIAEASLALTEVFAEAQRAADLYIENIRRRTGADEPVRPDAEPEQTAVEPEQTAAEPDQTAAEREQTTEDTVEVTEEADA